MYHSTCGSGPKSLPHSHFIKDFDTLETVLALAKSYQVLIINVIQNPSGFHYL